MSWLDDWWEETRMIGHEKLEPPDPGHPAWYGTATGAPTYAPWSAVLGAVARLPKVYNLPDLRASVMRALGKPEYA